MAIQANLIFPDGNWEYGVINASYELSQAIDVWGIPRDDVRGHIINVTIIPVLDDPLILNWATGKTLVKDGEIKYKQADGKPVRIRFRNAFCINYREDYQYDGVTEVRCTLKISAMCVELENGAQLIVPGFEHLKNNSSQQPGSASEAYTP